MPIAAKSESGPGADESAPGPAGWGVGCGATACTGCVRLLAYGLFVSSGVEPVWLGDIGTSHISSSDALGLALSSAGLGSSAGGACSEADGWSGPPKLPLGAPNTSAAEDEEVAGVSTPNV